MNMTSTNIPRYAVSCDVRKQSEDIKLEEYWGNTDEGRN